MTDVESKDSSKTMEEQVIAVAADTDVECNQEAQTDVNKGSELSDDAPAAIQIYAIDKENEQSFGENGLEPIVESDEFLDAMDEDSQQQQDKPSATQTDLSEVITAIKDSVRSNIPDLKAQQDQDKETKEEKKMYDGLEGVGEKQKEKTAAVADGEVVEGFGENLMAASEPNSPRPEAATLNLSTEAITQDSNAEDLHLPANENIAELVTPPTPGIAPPSAMRDNDDDDTEESPAGSVSEKDNQDSNASSREETDNIALKSVTNELKMANIDYSEVKANFLSPRAQERFDNEMLKGVTMFFNNQFSEAKTIFERRASQDPLYALGLGSMAFIQAITSYNPKDVERALSILTDTYNFANAQVEAASAQKPLKDTVSHYITNLMGTNSTPLPTNTRPFNKYELQEQQFMSNGALRAHVIKAECGLLMAILYLSMETMVGYLKAGLNLRRAYSSYSLVWQEYKRMGQHFHKYMDHDTVSAIQFGIGSVHLLLSSLPSKILQIVSAFGWKADKHLGFALLKVCLEGKRIRSPLASLMLLSYYVTLTSYAPQVLTRELIQPAIECLLDAQQSYPNSAFFLFFAGRVSRLARNIPLSTQSFSYTIEVTQGDWAETTLGNLATFEIAFNAAMALDWANAAVRAHDLQSKYNSPAFLKFFYGACMEMLGNRTEAILAFAEAPKLIEKKRNSEPEQYVASRVAFFEISGYQDLDFSLPALEILLTSNAFPCMTPAALEKSLELVEQTLNILNEREKLEYDLRKVELVPETAAPDYYDQRGTLLLLRASILNALGRYKEGIPHLNWVIDNKDKFKHTNWLVPFAYWESGNLCWGTEQFTKARALWESTLNHSGFNFEYRLATRLNLAIQHASELGVPETIVPKPSKGKTTHGRKRLSIVSSKSTGSIVFSS